MQTKIKQDILDKINSKNWFHSIKISEDIITPGQIKYDALQEVTRHLQIPERLDGLTVLDIGGWDGFFSFEAERRGAKKVVIYDLPDPNTTGFNVAKELLNSKVEYIQGDVYDISPEKLGSFDIVFFFGVLYHLRYPLLALDRIWEVAKQSIYLETLCIDNYLLIDDETVTTVPDLNPLLDRTAMYQFYRLDEANPGDFSNWFARNKKALEDSLLSAGFQPEFLASWGPRIAYRGQKIPEVQEYKRCDYSADISISFTANNDVEKMRQRVASRRMLSSQSLETKIVEELKNELRLTKAELTRSQEQIIAMESSKFWKLRSAWFKLKNLLKKPEKKITKPAKECNTDLKFSVITPSYCQGRFIERTIQSVLQQRSPDIDLEYIVCDGGSNDETIEILKRYQDNLTWISEKDGGQGDAVNKGIDRTNGEIIAWINSDDIYYPGTFAAVKEIFAKNPEVMVVYGDADHIDIEDNAIENYPTEPWDYKHLFEICYLCQPAVFFRRELVEKCGNLDDTLKYCMDYELWLRYGQHTQFYYLPRKLSGSRMYQDNKTLSQRVAVHYEINEMFSTEFKKVPEKWIFAYAHIKIDETLKLNRACLDENRKFVNEMVRTSIWSFWRWKKLPSPKGLARMVYWLLHANSLWLRDKIQTRLIRAKS